MVSREDIQRLIHRPDGGRPILSVFLDMAVDSNNKRRQYAVFLSKERGRFAELDSERETHHVTELGDAFDRVGRWIDESFDPENKGLAIYTELGGEWLEALQSPVPLPNRLQIADRPIIAPLVEVVESNPVYAIFVVDREHLRLLSVRWGQVLADERAETEPDEPRRHAVQAGGEAAKGFQKWKAEETRHFFKEFAAEAVEFCRRHRPDHLVLAGTDENVKGFLPFLTVELQEKVVHTTAAPIDAGAPVIVERLTSFFAQQHEQRETRAVEVLSDRVRHNYFATAGIQQTLEQLQEGKVEALIVARDLHRAGSQCQRCGFFLARTDSECPYCGGQLRNGVDVVEAMIRLAEEQEIAVGFADQAALAALKGAGGLLKF
jgi:peptide subunit release factor 1 (eRF1)